MKIVYSHLLNFLKKKPSIEELSKKLFQLGHEHELEGEIFDELIDSLNLQDQEDKLVGLVK